MGNATIWSGVLLSTSIWLWIIRRYDRLSPEPFKLLIRIGLIGGFCSVFIAGICNNLFQAALSINANTMTNVQALILAIFVGVNEETCKGFITIALIRHLKEFDEPIDALIYAMTVALGFAMFENLEYATIYGSGVLLERALMSIPAHLAFASIWGYGIMKAKYVYQDRSPYAAVLPYILLAALCHTAFDYFLFLKSLSVLLIFPLLVGLMVFAHRRLLELSPKNYFKHPY